MKKILFVAVASGVLMLSGCFERNTETVSDTRSRAQADQERVMTNAQRAVPTPRPENFAVRKAVAQWSEQVDAASEWYIYVTNMNNEYTGYYVAASPPVNYCLLMTPPDRIRRVENVDCGGGWCDEIVIEQAPNLDGLYASGGGCDMWYWEDAATGGMVGTVAKTTNLQFSSVPFAIDVPRLGPSPTTE